MSISIWEPSHGPQMWAIFWSPSTRKQLYRKCLIQSSSLLLRLVCCLNRRQTGPCSIISRMDQRSIVLYLHLKGLSAHAIHDDLVATLGPRAVTYSTVTGHLREAKLGTAEVTVDPESRSYHLAWTIPTGLYWQLWRKCLFRPCENLPAPPTSYALPSMEGSPNRSGSYDRFFAGCRIVCQRFLG
jgi:hypothetical protein